MDSRTRELLAISSGIFAKRRPHLELCQQIAEFMYPSRADFTQEMQLGGDDFGSSIYDSYHVMALKTLGNGIDSTLRQGDDWFKVGTGDDDRDEQAAVAQALDFATRQLHHIIRDPRSTWKRTVKEADMDWVAFGNPFISIEESATRDHLSFRAWHPKTGAWMANENGNIDCVHRKFKMQARNMKSMRANGRWKGEALHADVDLACKLEPHKEFECLHILMPTAELYASDGGKLREIRHPFISIYIDLDHETYLNEMGSPVFNYVVPRWLTLGTDPNGFSPAARDSLSDGRMLQAISRIVLEQGEKAVDPPTVGDGEVFSRDINLYAGGHTAIDLPDGRRLQDVFTTVQTSEGIRVGVDLKQDVRELIAQHMLLDRLFLPNLRDMTATESGLRHDEYRRVALPFYEPIQDEYHSPVLGIAFEMAVNMGIIPAQIFPDELRDADVKFTFNSPLNEAEGRKVVDAFLLDMQLIAAGSQVDQTVAGIFDVRKATMDAVRGAGSKPDWVLPESTIKKNDAEAEQVKRMAQGAQIAREGAGVVSDASNAALAARNAGLVPA